MWERIAIRFSPTSCFFHSLGGILPLHPRLQQKHVMSLVALIDEVMQWLAGVMRIITIDANSPAVIYHFLKNVSLIRFLSITIFFVPSSYFAVISRSSADCASVITISSLRTTAQMVPFFSIFSIFIVSSPFKFRFVSCWQTHTRSTIVSACLHLLQAR